MKFEDMVKDAELEAMRSRFRDRYTRGFNPEYYGTIRIDPVDAAKMREETRQKFRNPFPKIDDLFTVQPFSKIPSGSIFFWEYKYDQGAVKVNVAVDDPEDLVDDEHAGMVQNPITGEWKWL